MTDGLGSAIHPLIRPQGEVLVEGAKERGDNGLHAPHFDR